MDANPLHAWHNLSRNGRIAVVGGAAALALFLYLHKGTSATDQGASSDSSYRDQGTTAPDAGYDSGNYSGGGYYGGGGMSSGEPPLSTAAPTTSALDGTTPETPVVNVAAPDLSDIAAAIREVSTNNVDALATGGGAPQTDHTKHAAPKRSSSFKTVTRVNKKTGTTQTVHDRPGTTNDTIVKSVKTKVTPKRATVHKAKRPARRATPKHRR